MKFFARLFALFCLLPPASCLLPDRLNAQLTDYELRQERLEIIEELRWTENASGSDNKLFRKLNEMTGWSYTYGSSWDMSYVSDDQTDRSKNTQDALDHVWENSLNIYLLSTSADQRSKFYFRTGTSHYSNSRSNPAIRGRDWIQPGIDMLYYERAFGKKKSKAIWTVGRQFMTLERGITMGAIADGIKFEWHTRRFQHRWFAAHSTPGANNVDFLAPSAGRDKRLFAGYQTQWRMFQRLKAGWFGLMSIDRNHHAPQAGQVHEVDALYYGVQWDAMLLTRLRFEGMAVKQSGQTHSDFATTADAREIDIDAHAGMAGLTYYFDHSMKPKIHADYIVASGDADAVGNVFSPLGGSGSLAGSGAGGNDERFITAGAMNLGYALAPTLTNIRVLKTGFSLKPFARRPKHSMLAKFSIHPTYYRYEKDKAAGAISDPYIIRGNGASKDIGSEIDLKLEWRMASDMKYKLKMGLFTPGAAYGNTRDDELFVRFNVRVDL